MEQLSNDNNRLPQYLADAETGSAADTAASPLRLLGIWAHPDDEAYLSAGLMARTVKAGGRVTVVALSDGEAGFPEDDPRPETDRARQRRSELRTAMAEIGVSDVRFLGIPDGAVEDADEILTVARLAQLIAETEADAIVTFGPDGITGHPDHIANWRLSTQAWLKAGRGELWYAAKTEAWLDEWRELHDSFGVWMTEEPTGVAADDIELVVDLDQDEVSEKRAVLAGHASQTDVLAGLFGEDVYRRWVAQETFRRPTTEELRSVAKPRIDSKIGLVAS